LLPPEVLLATILSLNYIFILSSHLNIIFFNFSILLPIDIIVTRLQVTGFE
jgi:hypothetical protein